VSLLLAVKDASIPVIVVRGSGVPAMLSAFGTVARVPGLGQFTCCQRDHNIDGREIQCDKIVIGRVMWQMLDVKISKLRAAASEDPAMTYAFRMWQANFPHFMTGLTCDLMPPQPTTIAEFLKECVGHLTTHTAHYSPLPGVVTNIKTMTLIITLIMTIITTLRFRFGGP